MNATRKVFRTMPRGVKHATVVTLVLATALGTTQTLYCDDHRNDESYKSFIDEVGEFLFFLAWPTAVFSKASFEGLSAIPDGVDIKVKLHGKSSINDGPLWTELVVRVRNGDIEDIRWGQNNAMIAQPGQTITALGEVLAELTAEFQKSRNGASASSSSSLHSASSTYGYYFTNNCSRPVQLAIHYLTQGGNWKTEGWWKFESGKSAYLSDSSGRLSATNRVWYFYAETTDGSGWEWSGDSRVAYLGTRKLSMKKLTDEEGDNNWHATCN